MWLAEKNILPLANMQNKVFLRKTWPQNFNKYILSCFFTCIISYFLLCVFKSFTLHVLLISALTWRHKTCMRSNYPSPSGASVKSESLFLPDVCCIQYIPYSQGKTGDGADLMTSSLTQHSLHLFRSSQSRTIAGYAYSKNLWMHVIAFSLCVWVTRGSSNTDSIVFSMADICRPILRLSPAVESRLLLSVCSSSDLTGVAMSS